MQLRILNSQIPLNPLASQKMPPLPLLKEVSPPLPRDQAKMSPEPNVFQTDACLPQGLSFCCHCSEVSNDCQAEDGSAVEALPRLQN